MVSDAKFKSIHEEEIKILVPKQMLQRLPIALAQIKTRSTSKNLLNKTRQIIYSLHRANKTTKKVCNNIMKSINTILMNSSNSGTCDPHRLLFNLTDIKFKEKC